MFDSRMKLNECRPGCGVALADLPAVVAHVLTCDLPEFIDAWLLIALAVDNSFDVPTQPQEEPYSAGALSCALATVDMVLDSPDHEYPGLYHEEPCDMCRRPQCHAPECDTARDEYTANLQRGEDERAWAEDNEIVEAVSKTAQTMEPPHDD